jgi:DNA replication protein DnaC
LFGHDKWLGLLIDRESSSRETKRFESRMRTAKMRHLGASPEDIDYKSRRGLDKALDHCPRTNGGQGLAPADADRTLDQRQTQSYDPLPDRRCKASLRRTGPCGVGKTWLACALAQSACRDGITVLYKRMPRLFDELDWLTETGVSRACSRLSPKPNC